jgi:hypothetical protein
VGAKNKDVLAFGLCIMTQQDAFLRMSSEFALIGLVNVNKHLRSENAEMGHRWLLAKE